MRGVFCARLGREFCTAVCELRCSKEMALVFVKSEDGGGCVCALLKYHPTRGHAMAELGLFVVSPWRGAVSFCHRSLMVEELCGIITC